ncbi:MAG: DUF262 domain-containing protein, partial [Algiphilus sp.]|uniref:DUF262 domain-containing protein n=1 Tax=Algiphilus sp. TaxID=1872431 RepID=UPI0032EB4461
MSATHKITPSSPRLSALLADVDGGNVKIPVFQREYVWTDEQIMGLLDSIYQGYPVGSLLLWSTKAPLNHERNIGGFKLPDTPTDFPVNYVLDGQQRLTTLYGVFNSERPNQNNELASRFDVCFDFAYECFVHASQANPLTSINLRLILDTTKLFPALEKFDAEPRRKIATLTERFKDYEFPIVTIRDRSNQEVCRIFQRINSSGTTLSTLELLSAWTWSDHFNLRNELERIADDLRDQGYEAFDQALVMRSLAAIVMDQINSEALVDADPKTLIGGVSTLKEAIHSLIDFLGKELRIYNATFLPFPIMVVPLVKFFSNKLYPTSEQLSVLRRWFWYAAFTQRYKAGTNTK